MQTTAYAPHPESPQWTPRSWFFKPPAAHTRHNAVAISCDPGGMKGEAGCPAGHGPTLQGPRNS